MPLLLLLLSMLPAQVTAVAVAAAATVVCSCQMLLLLLLLPAGNPDDWDATMRVNALTPMRLIRALVGWGGAIQCCGAAGQQQGSLCGTDKEWAA